MPSSQLKHFPKQPRFPGGDAVTGSICLQVVSSGLSRGPYSSCSGESSLALRHPSPQDLPRPPGPGLGWPETQEGWEGKGRANQFAPFLSAQEPGLAKPVWQAARSGVGAVTDRLVIGKLPSLAQECCLVTMATSPTSGLTKAQGICYLKPGAHGAHGFRDQA